MIHGVARRGCYGLKLPTELEQFLGHGVQAHAGEFVVERRIHRSFWDWWLNGRNCPCGASPASPWRATGMEPEHAEQTLQGRGRLARANPSASKAVHDDE